MPSDVHAICCLTDAHNGLAAEAAGHTQMDARVSTRQLVPTLDHDGLVVVQQLAALDLSVTEAHLQVGVCSSGRLECAAAAGGVCDSGRAVGRVAAAKWER